MLRDVFYYGQKPNAHPREKFAVDLVDARNQSTTEHFWIINEFCDYRNFEWDFDFEFLPDEDVWAKDHNNIWPSQHQKDSGTWLCAKQQSEINIYRCDVDPVIRKNIKSENWVILDSIDESKFDFSWHPDPTDPPFIYKWGSKFFPPELKHVVEYQTPNATNSKYMEKVVELSVSPYFVEVQKVKENSWIKTWRPDPMDPPFIYVWGNKYIPAEIKSTVEFHVPGATSIKYMPELVEVEPEYENWIEHQKIDKTKFDFSWRPDPREPAYIYVWGNRYISGETQPTLEYHTPGATDKKYMGNIDVLPEYERWVEYQKVDKTKFDLSWRPDPGEPPFIYVWGNKYIPAEIEPTLEYHVPNATDKKYMGDVEVLPQEHRWIEIQQIDKTKFNLSWRPDPREPAYIYIWGNEYIPGELQSTIEYHVPNAVDKKYMGNVEVLPQYDRWVEYQKVDKTKFNLTWRPDPREPAYIYVWGNIYNPGEEKSTIEYHVPGATDKKYMGIAPLEPEWDRWKIHDIMDQSKFDFSWRPDPNLNEPPYIYVWGNKHVPGEVSATLEYHVPNATDKKYMGDVDVLPQHDRWVELQPIDKTKFDFTWRANPKEPAYIYVWGNIYIPGEEASTLEYHVPGATDKKYMGIAPLEPEWDRWKIHTSVDKSKFDFSWRPDPKLHEPPYIYVWGNKYIPGEIQPTLEYYVPGATDRKYMGNVEVTPEWEKYKILVPIDKTKFDFSWRPDPREPAYIYVWGNQHNIAEVEPTIEYYVPGATERKYMNDAVATTIPITEYWNILIPVENFDFSWRPDPGSPPYIYVFGNQWNDAITEPTIEYNVPGATDRKYITDVIAQVSPMLENWNKLLPVENFDFSWRPNPNDPPYIYVFGNQWHDSVKEPTLEYHVPNAIDKKYVTDIIAQVKPIFENYKQLLSVENFDFSWRPDPGSPPYIYVFGNQWNDAITEPTLEYHVEGATDKKYITDIIAYVKPSRENFNELIPIQDFDFSWRPNPNDPPYIYVFGNQWHDSVKEPTLEYHVPGATDKKYITDIKAIVKPDMKNWTTNYQVENFDYSWRPDPDAPPMIYQFGTVLDDIHLKDGPIYTVPENDGTIVYLDNKVASKAKINYPKYYIKTTLEDLIDKHPNEIFWALRENINYKDFNFDWTPTKENVFHINVFGSPASEITQTYFVNTSMISQGFTQKNYLENIELDDEYLSSLFKPMDMFYIDRGNFESYTRFEKLKEKFPNLQKTRFLNTWVNTISRCLNKCNTELCWILNSELDYTDFDFEFYPNPWQLKMIHVFGTQWSHWGTTFIVNKETFNEDTKYVKVIEHLRNINFVKKSKALATNCLFDVYLIDHGNTETDNIFTSLKTRLPNNQITAIKYEKSYLQTFKNLLETLPEKKYHFIWICSSVCDYNNFDFSYICDPFAKNQLHVFPSDKQKFGDTFLIDVNKLRSLISDMQLLDDYEKINFNQHQTVKRLPAPLIVTEYDTHIPSAMMDYEFPYAYFVSEDNKDLKVIDQEPISLWSQETKNIVVHSTGGTYLTIPKEVKNYVQGELYDYPYITKSNKLLNSKPLDIVFLSNGERCADENYEHLVKITKGRNNRVIRVDGVNGRANAYHAAANASETPWMFTVFAKLKVNKDFDWDWQPDRLQMPKHYIFTALNPVNGLTYGHQAMIAYNKNLTLLNEGYGLDFTLDDPHESIDMLSGTANFNTDPYSTWRTAFREVIKLVHDKSEISKDRLKQWLTVANGDFAEYSIKGANDAVEYYETVDGDYSKLKLSYEWKWLNEYFTNKYKL